jgi:cytochrome oxidase Cu insertion factor (SCO1/SenC/PrrC family)
MAETVPVQRRAVPTAPRGGRLGWQALALVVVTALTLGGLIGITALVSQPGEARPTATPVSYLVADVRPAPLLRLTGADGRPFDLASLRGTGALVFFGYTHCPDVCPATIGIVGQVLDRVGPGVRAVFVSIDPERDTVEWLADYLRYLPAGFSAATGSPADVRETADAWGVRYARVDADEPGEYSMNHTATVYLVDQAGLLRAEFPFGIEADAMSQVVGEVLAAPLPGGETPSPPPTPGMATPAAPSPAPSTTAAPPTPAPPSPSLPASALRIEIVSSSVWTRGSSPVILALYDGAGRVNEPDARVEVQLTALNGSAVGARVAATAVRPPGVAEVSYVASLDVPSPGWWKLVVEATRAGTTVTGTTSVAALEPGGTAPLGAAAPTVRTPTLDDVGGNLKAVTTDPAPDARLSRTSTVDALAAGSPFVLVIDSWRFRTSPACGQALVLARFLLDRWPDVPIIHLEPFEYDILSDTPVLQGTLSDPDLVPAAEAWGIGPAPWGPASMPWIFVVDGAGSVRAKYQAVIGSADIDVILALIAQE